MKTLYFVLSFLLLLMYGGCGGAGAGTDVSGNANKSPESTTLRFTEGDMMNDTIVPIFEDSFAETSATLVQAILAVNSLYPVNGENVSLLEFKKRYAEAKEALSQLESSADMSDIYLDLLPDPKSVKTYIAKYRGKINPKEVEAILNSSQSKSVLKPLMAHYKVNARKALEILQNAEQGLYTQYTDEAARNEKIVNMLKVVRDTSALTVTIGAAVITAGGSAVASAGVAEGLSMGLAEGASATQAAGLLIQGTNAVVKLSKSSVELVLGKDGALDKTFQKSGYLKALATADEVVSLVSIKGLLTKGHWDDAGKAISDMVYISGKARQLVQDKKISFGPASVDVSDVTKQMKEDMKLVFKDPVPMVYGTPDGRGIFDNPFSSVFKEILSVLPEDMQIESTSDVLVYINDKNSTTDNIFAGTISGGWSGKDKNGFKASGSFVMHISTSGSISGSYSGDDSGTLTGSISSNGSMDVKSGGGAVGSGRWSGTVRRNKDGSLSGSGSWSAQGYSGGWSGSGS